VDNASWILADSCDSARPRMLWIAHSTSPGLQRCRAAGLGWSAMPEPRKASLWSLQLPLLLMLGASVGQEPSAVHQLKP
jgi:hypothetical protein